MTTIKTRWITHLYDPQAPAPEPKPKPEYYDHHLVYAAMLDGLRGKDALGDYTGICTNKVGNMQRELAREGYIRLGKHNSRPCYVLADEPDTYHEAGLTREEVFEIGVLKLRGYTQADLAKHFNVQKWTIADAMQGRKQYSENRI